MTDLFVGNNVFNLEIIIQVVLNIGLAFILAWVISWVYQKTHKGLSYSQSFMFTLIILTIMVSVVMMVIGHSLARAFALLGAFTIIRFRTVVKDTKDTAFVFFALAEGMAVGTGNYLIAIVSTLLVCAVIWFLSKKNFGSMRRYDYILNFYIETRVSGEKTYLKLFKEYLKSNVLLNINSRKNGETLELIFDVKFFSDKENEKFIKELNLLEGVDNIRLLTSKNDIEY